MKICPAQVNTFEDMMCSFPSFPLQTCLHFVSKGHHSSMNDCRGVDFL